MYRNVMIPKVIINYLIYINSGYSIIYLYVCINNTGPQKKKLSVLLLKPREYDLSFAPIRQDLFLQPKTKKKEILTCRGKIEIIFGFSRRKCMGIRWSRVKL
jgi:hypothetical protein